MCPLMCSRYISCGGTRTTVLLGYTSGGIRFAAKGTAKPAEQGSSCRRVPGIPHEHEHGPTLMETMIKGQGEKPSVRNRLVKAATSRRDA